MVLHTILYFVFILLSIFLNLLRRWLATLLWFYKKRVWQVLNWKLSLLSNKNEFQETFFFSFFLHGWFWRKLSYFVKEIIIINSNISGTDFKKANQLVAVEQVQKLSALFLIQSSAYILLHRQISNFTQEIFFQSHFQCHAILIPENSRQCSQVARGLSTKEGKKERKAKLKAQRPNKSEFFFAGFFKAYANKFYFHLEFLF